ncbi:hemin ABC transporter substrate-binding protein [Testudinibacter sp. TR-2022]|uniref:heme/hemin ABC transporter substrate-binding protein n=1 Tax=Testudinibacter sp. TR-2022 TaxID=2585029 RepID=UPI001119075D|nr:ABC transporter substrate-binding protein [Testudinibacter sp. TR-2022]TNH05538.1 hemin ABC transporter substrate-binding protein [Pasteurellaceae bacterium Phil31]TNH06969.1 hemin ABC transporter substrate-binding protein [Pasteurellaceae bacterium Phil11]TNH11570.1 hemin ABC transporter substrate-binding protein [Testudinibacter sp. TR-2022]TNH11937.1 hemin ABC transporter substrate-binding protein [Testudinibacter sp. TR-2022]TNH12637.1 hemin ABC transporter substrate-binding protein [Te
MKKQFILSLLLSLFFLSEVTLAQPTTPQRIIAVGAGVTELLEALDVGDQLIAVDSTSRRFADKYQIPLLGYQRNLASEGILALQPNLLIGSEEMGPESVLTQLRQAKIQIEVLENPQKNHQDLQQHIQRLGQLLAKNKSAEKLSAQVMQQIRQIQSLPRGKNRALFLLLSDKGQLSTGGHRTTINGMLDLMQLHNLSAEKQGYYAYSIEAVLALQPDILLLSERSLSQDLSALQKKYPFLQQLNATNQGCIFSVDGQALLGGFNLSSLRESQRIMQAIADNQNCLQ